MGLKILSKIKRCGKHLKRDLMKIEEDFDIRSKEKQTSSKTQPKGKKQ